MEVGDRVWFADPDDKRPYTVRAVTADGRWAVCTKPFAARHTVIYTVVDFRNQVRGRDNLVFGFGYETDEQCQSMAAMFEAGEAEHSRRYPPIELRVARTEKPVLPRPS